MKAGSVSVIIPVYNERRTVGSVIEVARTWPQAGEVIVVDDGSTDGTQDGLKRFTRGVKIITHASNKGKGHAIASGVRASGGRTLVFLDGDIVGLTHHDLDLLVNPVMQKKADMTLGLVRFWRIHTWGPDKTITGVRALKKSTIIRKLSDMHDVGYGIEFLLNHIHEDKRVVSVDLPGVYIMSKLEKQPVHLALGGYVFELWELAKERVRRKAFL